MRNFQRPCALLLALLVLLISIPLTACGNDANQAVVGTCGEYDVLYEELRFATLTYKDLLNDVYDKDKTDQKTIWDDPETAELYRSKLEESVYQLILDNYSVLTACSKYGISTDVFWSDTVQNAVNTSMSDLMATYENRDDFYAALDATYMTENRFRFVFAVEEMKNVLLKKLQEDKLLITSEEEFSDWLADGNCAYVQHVAVFNDEGEDIEMNRQLIETAAEGINNQYDGKDFNYYVGSFYNEDTSNTAPYYVLRHAHDDALVDAAVALQNPEDVTDIIETEDGFYILMRIAEGESTLEDNLSNLLNLYQWGIVSEKVAEANAKASIQWNEYGQSIDLVTMQ